MNDKIASWIPIIVVVIGGVITTVQMNTQVNINKERIGENRRDIIITRNALQETSKSQAINRAELAKFETTLIEARKSTSYQLDAIMRILTNLEHSMENLEESK